MKKDSNIQNRSILLMNYDVSKTSKENLMEINEQILPPISFVDDGRSSIEKFQEDQKEEIDAEKKLQQKYPNYCSAKDKTVYPTENQYGLEGIDAIVEGTCAYIQPRAWCKVSPRPKQKSSYILLPKDAKISFFESFVDYGDAVDIFLTHVKLANGREINRKKVIQEFIDIIPMNSVKQFQIGDSYYLPHVCFTRFGNDTPDYMSFLGYENQKGELYESPIQKDERTPRQKFVDKYGTWIQWTVVIATALAAYACEGCTLPLTYEILIELGVGGLVGYRELEKGNNVAGYTSFIIGMLPFFKKIPWLKTFKPAVFDQLADAFKNSGLNSSSTLAQWIGWYDNLPIEPKKLLNRMLRSDYTSANTFLKMTSKELGEEISGVLRKNIQDIWKTNPEKIIKIPLFKRLWVRELGGGITVQLAGLLVSIKYGDQIDVAKSEKLTQEQKDKLDGIYAVIPERQKNEMTVNLLNNALAVDDFINDPEMKKLQNEASKLEQKKYNKALDIYWKNRSDTIMKKKGLNVITLSENKDIPDVKKITTDKEGEKKYRDMGYLPLIETKKDISEGDIFIIINDMGWVKPLKKEENKKQEIKKNEPE